MSGLPFSARNKGAHHRIDNDFPKSARNGLLHILFDLVERDYMSWAILARELQRIGRFPPTEYSTSSLSGIKQARVAVEEILFQLSWEKTYDFCERLHNHLARDVGYNWNDEFQITTTKSEVQTYICEEFKRLFSEEGLAFEFTEGLIRRVGRKHTIDITTKAQVVLGDPRLGNARKHYDKALQFFRHPAKPDYENCVKEAVCAVEAAGKILFPKAKAATLGDLTKWFTSTKEIIVPKALIQTFTGIYAFRSGGDGVGHGGSAGGAATNEVAEYVLAVCASQIIYLVDLFNSQESDIPF